MMESIIHLVKVFNRAGENHIFWQKVLIGIGSTISISAVLIWKKRRNEIDSYHKSRYQIHDDFVSHFGKCHCERVSFKMQASKHLKAVDVPSKIRFPRVSIPFADFELLCDEHFLSIFSRNTVSSHREMHVFCSYCGVHILHAPTDNPTYVQVNADCLDHSTVKSFDVSYHTTGEENSTNIRSPVNDKLGSGYLSLKDGRDRVGSDIDPEENYPYCYYDNDSESSSTSKTTMTYDFTPNLKVMHHSQSETPSIHSYKSNGISMNRDGLSSNGSYIETVMGRNTPLHKINLNGRDQPTSSASLYHEEFFRHASNRHLNPDWSRGSRFVYNSIYNDNVVNRKDINKFKQMNEDSKKDVVTSSFINVPPFSSPVTHFDLNPQDSPAVSIQSFSNPIAEDYNEHQQQYFHRSRINYSDSNNIERLRKYL
mmetsp:Transcript_2572/g.3569  ORF Transcript_2572/g.3569 Transcript_2572/m.3569 type:complete len:425 (+) Transcript_2572:75-1349(+)